MRIAQQAGHGIEYAQLTGGTPTQRAPDSYCAWRVCHVDVNLARPACWGATAQRACDETLHTCRNTCKAVGVVHSDVHTGALLQILPVALTDASEEVPGIADAHPGALHV